MKNYIYCGRRSHQCGRSQYKIKCKIQDDKFVKSEVAAEATATATGSSEVAVRLSATAIQLFCMLLSFSTCCGRRTG